MKTNKRQFLSVILAALCAVVLALGVCFLLPKNNTTTAYANVQEEKDKLAQILGYSDFSALSAQTSDSDTYNATDFGSSTIIEFGGMNWFPVYAQKSGNDIILTLYLEDSVAAQKYCTDRTDYKKTDENGNDISGNVYQYSWIRAAINAGDTEEGYYYGNYIYGNTPTKYYNGLNDTQYPAVYCAPEAYDTFKDFTRNGKYKDLLIADSLGDTIWLPERDDAKTDGTWGLTSTYFGTHVTCSGDSTIWTRTTHIEYGYYTGCVWRLAATTGGGDWDNAWIAHGIRPAINLNLTALVDETANFKVNPDPNRPVADTTVFTYSGSPQTYLPTNFNEGTMKISDETENTQTEAGEYLVTVISNLNLFSPVTFTFTIHKATPRVAEDGKEELYDPASMPDLSAILSAANPVSGIAVAGTFTYNGNPSPTVGDGNYSWTFTPDDLDNYEIATGSISLTFDTPPEEDDDDDTSGGGGGGSGNTDDSNDDGTGDDGGGSGDDTGDSGNTGDGSDGSGSGDGTDGSGNSGDGSDGSGSGDGTGGSGNTGDGSDGSGSGGGTGGSGNTGDGSDGNSDNDNNSDNNSDGSTENNSDKDNDKKGVAAVWNWLKGNWWWLLIALAALVLTIIIIVALAKRRKDDDEDKKAKKAAAKEEKAKREEEQIRVLQQQAPVAAAGMVAAQPIIQQVPVQDNSAILRLEMELAEMRAKLANMPQSVQVQQTPAQPAPAPAPQSYYMPTSGGTMDYHAMVAEERARAAEAKLSEERVRTEERARAAEQRAMMAEERFLHGGAQQNAPAQSAAVVPTVVQSGIPAEVVVALLEAVKSNNVPVAAQLKPAVPPDAVVTTTTTVDRTKNKPAPRVRNDNTNFDVDGFYDEI